MLILIQVQEALASYPCYYCSYKERSLIFLKNHLKNLLEFSRLSYCSVVKVLCDASVYKKLCYYITLFLACQELF